MDGFDYVTVAREWIGTPFHHACAAKQIACDCIGLVVGAAKEVGLTERQLPDYASYLDRERQLSIILEEGIRVPEGEWQPGDVLWLRIRHHPQHFAILTGEGTFLHAYQSLNKVVETPLIDWWKERIMGVFRWRRLCS